jgi:dihydrofolate reductase
LQINVSLDGFTAGPSGELDWLIIEPEMWRYSVDQLQTVDTVLLGRVNYEGFYGYWPTVTSNPASTPTDREFSQWLDATPKLVFSKTLDKVEWQNSRLATGTISEEIIKLKQQPGKDMLIMNSTTLKQSFMQEGLLDDYWLMIHPVAVGEGKALFKGLKDRLRLRLLNSKAFDSGNVFLHYATRHS